MSNAALVFDNLTLGYDRHPAVHHLTGEVEKSSLTAIVGPNGAGKSTLLKGIAGLLKPLEGRIDRKGLKARNVAYLPQIPEIDRTFPISVYDLVATGLWPRVGALNAADNCETEIKAVLFAVGLVGFEDRPIGTLSGGQMQRTLFARLMLQDSEIILLDEPFTAVDSRTVDDLIDLIHRWRQEGRTVLAVLHDLELVRRAFPQTLLLARSQVAWGETAEMLSAENLARARQMCEATDPYARPCAQAA